MTIVRLSTYTCQFLDEDREQQFPSRDAALAAAAQHVGNWSYAKPIPADNVYLFGPGDGTTTVMVRQDFEFADEKGGGA